ncbi:MAG: type I-E CRISPR-associated protein Cas5/CasD [Anaerolineae bacterium]
MNVLLMRLVGPMQSWGVQSHFAVRDTGLEPSKSGVIGLICASLGRPRHADIADLAELRFGVRVDVEGRIGRDYQTAVQVRKASGEIKDCEPSARYYLAGARFLVGLEGEDVALLERIQHSLRYPIWPQYLGRKAFPPAEPVWLDDGMRPGEQLRPALTTRDWLGQEAFVAGALRQRPDVLRLVIEDRLGSEVRPDQPVSLAERRFAPRYVDTTFVPTPVAEEVPCTSPA